MHGKTAKTFDITHLQKHQWYARESISPWNDVFQQEFRRVKTFKRLPNNQFKYEKNQET